MKSPTSISHLLYSKEEQEDIQKMLASKLNPGAELAVLRQTVLENHVFYPNDSREPYIEERVGISLQDPYGFFHAHDAAFIPPGENTSHVNLDKLSQSFRRFDSDNVARFNRIINTDDAPDIPLSLPSMDHLKEDLERASKDYMLGITLSYSLDTLLAQTPEKCYSSTLPFIQVHVRNETSLQTGFFRTIGGVLEKSPYDTILHFIRNLPESNILPELRDAPSIYSGFRHIFEVPDNPVPIEDDALPIVLLSFPMAKLIEYSHYHTTSTFNQFFAECILEDHPRRAIRGAKPLSYLPVSLSQERECDKYGLSPLISEQAVPMPYGRRTASLDMKIASPDPLSLNEPFIAVPPGNITFRKDFFKTENDFMFVVYNGKAQKTKAGGLKVPYDLLESAELIGTPCLEHYTSFQDDGMKISGMYAPALRLNQ